MRKSLPTRVPERSILYRPLAKSLDKLAFARGHAPLRCDSTSNTSKVTQGGALDIDVTVYDPSDDVLYLQERETDSRVLLVAADKGTHKVSH